MAAPRITALSVGELVIRNEGCTGVGFHIREPHSRSDQRAGLVGKANVWSHGIDELHLVVRSNTCGGVAGVIDLRWLELTIGRVVCISDTAVVPLGVADFVHCPIARSRLTLR